MAPMRIFLRPLVHASLAVYAAQYLLGGFSFTNSSFFSTFPIVVGLALLYTFVRPILHLVSLPDGGISFTALNIGLTVVILHILASFVPTFDIQAGVLNAPRFLLEFLPASRLSVFWTLVISSVVISTVYNFFLWLAGKK